jgi:prepilin-type N-terminal cleavage/methylation domain-containing protein
MSRNQKGFTLLETLAAFAIVALSLGLMVRGLGLQARGEATGSQLLYAVSLAENHLTLIGTERTLEPGDRRWTGVDGLGWQETVSHWSAQDTEVTGLRAFRVVIEVTDLQSQRLLVRLETVKLGVHEVKP